MNTGNAHLDKFLARTPEQMLADAEASRLASEAFNRGEPVPSVSADDMRQLWDATGRLHRDHPPREDTAIGMSIFVAYGVTFADEPARFMAAQLRCQLLRDACSRGLLSAHMIDGEPDDKLFAAAAAITCNLEDLAETMLRGLLSKSSAEAASTLAELRAHGVDPEHPKIDNRLVRWVQENS